MKELIVEIKDLECKIGGQKILNGRWGGYDDLFIIIMNFRY